MDMESIIEDLELLNDEEISFSNIDILKLYVDDISQHPLLTKEEEIELFKRFHNGDFEARQILIKSNLRLVISIANKCLSKYKHNFLNKFDVIQEGVIGLIKAIDRFELGKDCKLSTYAAYYVFNEIQESLYKTNLINRSAYVIQQQKKINNYIDNCIENNEKIPKDKELAKILGLSPEQLDMAKNKDYEIVSLEDTVSYNSELMLKDIICDDERSFQELVCETISREQLIHLIKTKLKKSEAAVILLRYFKEPDNIIRMRIVGDIMGVRRQRVEQIEIKAFEKLKKVLKKTTLYEDEINYIERKAK